MVAKLTPSEEIDKIFFYNERKVARGAAECIGAENYPVDHDQMNEMMKLNTFLRRIETTSKGSITAMHISLNFDVSETQLSKEKLMEITRTYMQELGFGEQPYLVYQHFDAGHPHVHIVTTNIKPDGRRISLHHLANRKSEPARKMIEERFGLIKAEGRGMSYDPAQPLNAEVVTYGKSETKKAIQKVLSNIILQYKYASLEELNAVLKIYNITADRGTENSRVFQHHGLLYHVLGPDGFPAGVPIKASAFYGKAKLADLESRYQQNKENRKPHRSRVRNAVDNCLRSENVSLPDLIGVLRKQGIDLILRQNDAGLVYGLTYIDHVTKSVFNGSELGKKYSAKELQLRCKRDQKNPVVALLEPLHEGSKPLHIIKSRKYKSPPPPNVNPQPDSALGALLDTILQTEQVSGFIPHELRRKRRKKRRRNNPSADH